MLSRVSSFVKTAIGRIIAGIESLDIEKKNCN